MERHETPNHLYSDTNFEPSFGKHIEEVVSALQIVNRGTVVTRESETEIATGHIYSSGIG